MSKKQQDALIGRTVRINDDITLKAGESGSVVNAGKRGYEIDFGGDGSTFWFEMHEFTVLPNESTGTFAGQLVDADPYLATFSLNNPRRRRGLDIDSLNHLASSIKAQGLAQPILVRPLPGSRAADTFQDREEGLPLPIYELVCGERRLRASRIAGMGTIPMLVRELDDAAALELQLVENIEREDLDPMEEAEGFELLREKLGYSVEQIADRIGRGKGESYIYKTMKLCDLVPEAREAMYAGQLGRSTGLLVARYRAEQQIDVVAFIKSMAVRGEPAPYRTVSPAVFKRFNLTLATAVFDIQDASLVVGVGPCSSCPKRSGNQGDIFGDDKDSEDSCTDPDCFDSKRAAHIGQVKDQAAKDGIKVIDEDEARKAIPSAYARYMIGYSRLTDTAYTEEGNDGVEREVTFEDALRKMGKKAPKPRLLINPHTGAAEKVITDDLANQLADLAPGAEKIERRAPTARVDDRPEEVKALDDHRVNRAVTLRIFDAIRTHERCAAELLLVAESLIVEGITDNDLGYFEAYLGWDTDTEDKEYEEVQQIVRDKLKALPGDQLAQLLVMAGLERAGSEFLPATATAYGIDILAVRDKVAEDLEKQDAAEDEEEGADA